MRFLYNISIHAYAWAIRIASVWNAKARLWVNGRKNVIEDIAAWRKNNEGKLYWFHCASLGEFEQGRPLLEEIRKQQPAVKLLLTFFSPSGYEVRKNYSGADYICYLPADTPINAKQFIAAVKPTAVFFVKYEYWANYFFELKENVIPLYIVSAILRPEQRFFGVMKSFWKGVLQCVTHYFVQNETTLRLLKKNGFTNATLSGDTRFDRVASIQQNSKEIPELEVFSNNSFCIVGGSAWPEDEDLLIRYFNEHSSSSQQLKLILVPHETDERHIAALQKKLPQALRWSEREGQQMHDARCIIIDTIGLLSSIYRYADAVMIGGGFGKGIHNTLEAAAWSKPIFFGPNYHKFEEAKGLIDCVAAQSVTDYAQLKTWMDSILKDEMMRMKMGEAAGEFVLGNVGATERILKRLQ